MLPAAYLRAAVEMSHNGYINGEAESFAALREIIHETGGSGAHSESENSFCSPYQTPKHEIVQVGLK